jgi:hypothetical protein
MKGACLMEDLFQRLTHNLLEKNDHLSYGQARTMVELLWEDFESSRAKAGREYKGQDVTEKIVKQWIDYYGPVLHDFMMNNPKYKGYFGDDRSIKH